MNSKFNKKINIHNTYRDDLLNIYFFSRENLAKARLDIRICAYIPPRPLIVCNSDDLRQISDDLVSSENYYKAAILHKRDDGSIIVLSKKELTPEARDAVNFTLSSGLVGWVLAHEIGHAELHAGSNNGHLAFDGTAEGKQEQEADARAAELILSSDLLTQNCLHSMDELIEKSFSRFAADGGHAATVIDPKARWYAQRYKVTLDAKLPEDLIVYRAISIYRYVSSHHPQRDTTGYIDLVNSNVDLVNPFWRRFTPDFMELWFQ